LNKDTYLYFSSENISAIPKDLLTNKIANHGFNRLLYSIRIPKGSPLVATKSCIKIYRGKIIVQIFKINKIFFFTIYEGEKQSSPPFKIVFPDGAPPYPYPISLLAV